jgi:hypothetical protein
VNSGILMLPTRSANAGWRQQLGSGAFHVKGGSIDVFEQRGRSPSQRRVDMNSATTQQNKDGPSADLAPNDTNGHKPGASIPHYDGESPGLPQPTTFVRYNLRIPQELYDEIQALASARGTTILDFMRVSMGMGVLIYREALKSPRSELIPIQVGSQDAKLMVP